MRAPAWACALALLLGSASAALAQAASGEGRSFLDRLFGGSSKPQAAAPAASAPGPRAEIRCPQVEIRSGTETMAVYDKAGESNPLNLRHQVTIRDLARECMQSETIGTARVGVAGRIVLGPKGAPGSYTVPLRIAVLRGGKDSVFSNTVRVPVAIAPGQTSAAFDYVAEDVSWPLEPKDRLTRYLIFVGFDEKAPQARR